MAHTIDIKATDESGSFKAYVVADDVTVADGATLTILKEREKPEDLWKFWS